LDFLYIAFNIFPDVCSMPKQSTTRTHTTQIGIKNVKVSKKGRKEDKQRKKPKKKTPSSLIRKEVLEIIKDPSIISGNTSRFQELLSDYEWDTELLNNWIIQRTKYRLSLIQRVYDIVNNTTSKDPTGIHDRNMAFGKLLAEVTNASEVVVTTKFTNITVERKQM